MLSEEEFVRFNAAETHLVEDVDPDDIIPFFKSRGILNDSQIQELRHASGDSRASKSASLINLLRDHLPNLDTLIDALYHARYKWHVAFLKNFPKLPSDIFDGHEAEFLNGAAIISNNESDQLLNSSFVAKQGDCCAKDTNANTLPNACPESSSSYSKQSSFSTSSNNFALASKGKIPKRPDVYVHRAELVNKLKELVSRLQHQPGWVVLHGMAGSGKSVLAAEVARDPSVLGSMFPQIFWIPFDRPLKPTTPSMSLEVVPCALRPSHSHDEQAELLSKLLFLYGHVTAEALRRNIVHPQNSRDSITNVEQLLHVLPDLLWKHCPRILLVLDDVWSSYHVQKFDELSCRYLMTTRDETVIYEFNAYKEIMAMHPTGFTRQQTLEVLGKWLRCSVEELPKIALHIYDETDGHPFFIALIGSLLKTHRNRWSYYYNEIKQNSLDAIKTQTHIGSYAHKSFGESVSLSVMELSENWKQKYLELAIFPLKSSISAKVLSIYWDMELHAVEDLMDQFVWRHLVFREFDDKLDCDIYTLHNLLHRFLQTVLDDSTIKKNHRQLIANYQKAAKNNWAMLPKDDYIHSYIGYHLNGAALYDYFPSVFLNMKFLYDKSLICTYQSILDDFTSYRDHIRVKNEEKFDDFEKFLRRHAQRFSTPSVSCESSNLLHLALEEHPDSCIYKAAIIYL